MRAISQDGTIDIPYEKAVCECGGKFKIMLREDAEKLRNEA